MHKFSCTLSLKFINNFLSQRIRNTDSEPNSKVSGYFREGSVEKRDRLEHFVGTEINFVDFYFKIFLR